MTRQDKVRRENQTKRMLGKGRGMLEEMPYDTEQAEWEVHTRCR